MKLLTTISEYLKPKCDLCGTKDEILYSDGFLLYCNKCRIEINKETE